MELKSIKLMEDGSPITAVLRFENYFSITSRTKIAKYFPEYSHLIKWHLTSLESPMHYVENTVYLAGDLDFNGQRKGEVKIFKYNIRCNDGLLFGDETPVCGMFDKQQAELAASRIKGEIVPVPYIMVDGKERQLDAARKSAVWPEATNEQLSLPKEQLTALLLERLPKLMAEFKADMVGLFGEDFAKLC